MQTFPKGKQTTLDSSPGLNNRCLQIIAIKDLIYMCTCNLLFYLSQMRNKLLASGVERYT